MSKKRIKQKYRDPATDREFTLTGREHWAADELIKAGPVGVTPIERPAPRWSAYVFDLRRMGISIETIHEPHGGAYPGNHARYVLRTPLEPVPTVEAT